MMRCRLISLVLAPAAVAALPPLDPWPLEGTVQQATLDAAALPLLKPTGLLRADYLPVINGIVGFWQQYQAANGSIIDPFAHEEIQYATPTYAFASSVLVKSGFNTSVLASSALALDSALSQLSNGTAPQGHTNFFIFPIMMCFWNLRPLVDAGHVAQWEAWLRNINPSIYATSGNWGLVAVGGEYLRTTVGGYGNASWWQGELAAQFEDALFTANGQYQDHSGSAGLNPMPYDAFPCKYLTVLLAQGYDNATAFGPLSARIGELMRRSAWTHLLMQSPWGEIPTGGRSSQHTWNEAASAAIYETQAAKARAAGDAQGACMFKRAARLSLGSVKRWQNGDGSLQIVKNRFPPAARWGYEGYSFFSQYNLLPASQLATAWAFAEADDGATAECTTFADAGGFAFALPEFKAVIANAGGTYALLETGSDPHYDSTGLQRVHVNTCATQPSGAGGCVAVHPLLGPTAGPPQENGGVSWGPWWSFSANGTAVTRLGNQTYLDVTAVTLTPGDGWSPASVAFSLQYVLLGPQLVVTEAYNLSAAGRIDVTAGLAHAGGGPRVARFGVSMPVFGFDGATNTTLAVNASDAAGGVTGTLTAVGRSWGSMALSVVAPGSGHALTPRYDAAATIATRNGVVAVLDVEVSPVSTDAPVLSYSIVAAGCSTSAGRPLLHFF